MEGDLRLAMLGLRMADAQLLCGAAQESHSTAPFESKRVGREVEVVKNVSWGGEKEPLSPGQALPRAYADFFASASRSTDLFGARPKKGGD